MKSFIYGIGVTVLLATVFIVCSSPTENDDDNIIIDTYEQLNITDPSNLSVHMCYRAYHDNSGAELAYWMVWPRVINASTNDTVLIENGGIALNGIACDANPVFGYYSATNTLFYEQDTCLITITLSNGTTYLDSVVFPVDTFYDLSQVDTITSTEIINVPFSPQYNSSIYDLDNYYGIIDEDTIAVSVANDTASFGPLSNYSGRVYLSLYAELNKKNPYNNSFAPTSQLIIEGLTNKGIPVH